MDGLRDPMGAQATITWEHFLIHEGKMFSCAEYDSDTDISTPKQISLKAVGEPAHIVLSLSASAACKVQLMKNVVIGTGGSASAGSAVSLVNRDNGNAKAIGLEIKKDYLLGSSGQSAGTEIDTFYVPGAAQGALRAGGSSRGALEWILPVGVLYGLVITAINDNTVLSWSVEAYED
jgi:hypothetical protein